MDNVNKIAIYGTGGFAREVACTICRINAVAGRPVWNLVGFFDDNPAMKGKSISHFGKCLGGMDVLNSYSERLALTVAIGTPSVVKRIVGSITNEHVWFPNVIHPDFHVADPETFVIGKGNIIQSGCLATCNVTIGDFNILNDSVAVAHDDVIGNFNAFMPMVRVSGEVVIGDLNFFGVSSCILQQIKIGDGVRLAAGSALMSRPRDGYLYLGVPAKKVCEWSN